MPATYVELDLPRPEVLIERRADGSLILTSPDALQPYPDRITDRLFETARRHPERTLIARRIDGGDWRRVSYGEAAKLVVDIAGNLARRDLGPERPIVILSGSSIEHALLSFAALHAGIPFASVTPAYSLLSPDLAKLKYKDPNRRNPTPSQTQKLKELVFRT